MSDRPHARAKIYDRPERPKPPLAVIVILLVILCLAGYFVYQALHHRGATPVSSHVSTVSASVWKRALT
jgi:hypothetical protein